MQDASIASPSWSAACAVAAAKRWRVHLATRCLEVGMYGMSIWITW